MTEEFSIKYFDFFLKIRAEAKLDNIDKKRPVLQFIDLFSFLCQHIIFDLILEICMYYIWDSYNGVLLTHYATQSR